MPLSVKLPPVYRRQQRQRSRERAHGGARVAQKQCRFTHRQLAAQAVYAQGTVGLGFEAAAQFGQGRQHDLGVVGVEQVHDVGVAHAECGQQQHPVRDAFGARQPDRAARADQRCEVEVRNGIHQEYRGSDTGTQGLRVGSVFGFDGVHAPVGACVAGLLNQRLQGIGIV
jgi:hypothetical protein